MSLKTILPQLLIIALLIFLYSQFSSWDPFLPAALTYGVLAQVMRRTISKDHRAGIRKVKKGHFKEAIPHFKESYAFFQKNGWLDKYRFVTLLSASQITYSEMALNNIAYSYGQIGNGKESRAYYEQCLREFPDNAMAKGALNLLNSSPDSLTES